MKREALAKCIFGFPPVESNHRQVSGALNSSQQGPPASIDSAGLENGNAEHLPQRRIHLNSEQINGFFVLRRGRRHGQAREIPPTKMGSWQVHLLAQSIRRRYKSQPSRKSLASTATERLTKGIL
jgi:hypothetical protein